MRILPVVVFGALLAAAGCSSSSSTSPGGTTSSNNPPPGAKLQTFELKMDTNVAAGQEIFECQYVTLPNVAGWMVSGEHTYTAGSHHLLIYSTDLTSLPAGGNQVQNCYEGTGSFMSHVRGVLYGAQTPTGSQTFPAGVGLATTASEVLLFQVHYINATASALDAHVDVKLTLDTGTDIVTNAGILFLYDPFIDVPAGAKAQAQMRVNIPRDITLLYASSHYHARGVGYGAWLDTPTQMATKPFYSSASWASPPIQTMTMPIAAGSMIRFECDYDNTNGTQEYFQGPSAATNEMCMFVGAYYPDMGELANYGYASPGPDMFGTAGASGTNCNDTLSCLKACPGTSAGSSSSSSSSATPFDTSPCVQKCMVASCSTATTPLFPLLECLNSNCSTQCATTSSSDCTTCVANNCGADYLACQNHTCN
jgi:hypothetical protein